ncbi:hypothetical protein NC652_034487 [Populus alba x Populus x berolinensis]|nr:hypothetical protein NC652_034487 [Populus alba x Populus x berolinensis]
MNGSKPPQTRPVVIAVQGKRSTASSESSSTAMRFCIPRPRAMFKPPTPPQSSALRTEQNSVEWLRISMAGEHENQQRNTD